MKKLIASLLVATLLAGVYISEIQAKRLLPRAKHSQTTARTSVSTSGVKSLVKFRGDRRAIILTLQNLDVASRVEYSLTYSSRGLQQGAGGTVTGGGGQTRELLFGTCSAGVCRYDSGITNARLVITTTLKSGRKVVKPFKLRV